MPRKRMFRRRRRRRRGGSARRRVNSRTAFTGSGQRTGPMLNQFKTTLKYNDVQTLNPGGAVPSLIVIRANDLFDPRDALGGHQPRGFDQIMTMYDHFTVIGSKITCLFMSTTLAAETPLCGICLLDSSPPAARNTYLESSTNTSKYLVQGSGATQVTLKFSTKHFLGRSHPLSDPDLKGNIAGEPAELAFFHIWADGLGADTSVINIAYSIDYIVVFTEPVVPGQS